MSNTKKQTITKVDRTLSCVSYLLLVLYWIYLILKYPDLPESIPTHFNGFGKLDALGPKYTLFFSPVLATLMVWFLTTMQRNPRFFSLSKRNKRTDSITVSPSFYSYLTLGVLVIFFFLDYQTIQIATTDTTKLGVWFLPFAFLVLTAPVFWFYAKSSQSE